MIELCRTFINLFMIVTFSATKNMIVYLIYLSVLLVTVTSCGDFYWREYDGVVPSDAIPAGRSGNNEVFYIGNAYVHGIGISMGAIRKGRREITVPGYGVRRASKMVKILCAEDHKHYYWNSVKSGEFGEKVKDKCPVLGGYDVRTVEDNHYKLGTLHIGRKNFHDELIIGSIASYSLERPGNQVRFYFAYDGDERNSVEFDVLMYSPKAVTNNVASIYNSDVIPIDN